MLRLSYLRLVCGSGLILVSGCAHPVESRVVQAFSESIRQHDLERLKAQTSEAFERRALASNEVFDAIDLIDLPDGRHKVVKVVERKEEGDAGDGTVHKRVTVEVGNKKEAKTKVVYLLKRDEATRRWVVDDLYLSKADMREKKSFGARLALLTSLRESLEAWEGGRRDAILATSTPEFAQSLTDLSPSQLSQFAGRVTADLAPQARALPNERIGDETAELRVPKPDAELVLKFRKVGDHWRLDDLAVESRRAAASIASARDVTAAMSAALRFQQAYQAADKKTLQHVCTAEFFEGSLAQADLSLVKLPAPATGLGDFDVKLDGAAATFIVPAGKELLKISLVRQATEQLHAASQYRVEDVTIYELTGRHDKRLAALFTGHATLQTFGAALLSRDLKTLRAYATHDFNQRVWKRVSELHVAHLPLGELRPGRPVPQQTLFKGPLMEVLVDQGGMPLTYVLREENGRMMVDDILAPATEKPESLKVVLEIAVPLLEFTAGLEASDLKVVRGNASHEFSRVAWNHLEATPDFEPDPVASLRRPLTRLRLSAEGAHVGLGDEHDGAEVTLVKETGRYRVDDVMLIFGPEAGERIALKHALRTQLSQGNQQASRAP